MHVNTLTKVWHQVMGYRDMHKGTQGCTFLQATGNGVEQTWGVRWTCIHVLMHIHILTKVWDQMRGDYHEERSIQGSTCLCATIQR